MKDPSSVKVLIARIAAKPTTGTVIIPVTYPKTQIPPSREYMANIKNGGIFPRHVTLSDLLVSEGLYSVLHWLFHDRPSVIVSY